MNQFLNIYSSSKRILLVGTYPPPIGGVSTHIYRARNILLENGHNVKVFDTSKSYIFSYIKLFLLFLKIFFGRFTVVHLHTNRRNIINTVLFAKKFRSVKLFFTDHNPRLFIKTTEEDKRYYLKFFNSLDLLIGVSDEVFSNYEKYGVKSQSKKIILNAFLPPKLLDEAKIIHTYDDKTRAYMQNKDPLIVANAYKLSLIDGVDLYGLDLCVDLVYRLKKTFPNIGFIFALPDASENTEHLRMCEERITEYEIGNSFLIIKQALELWPLIKHAKLFIRPTITDGDAISIRESLFFNTKVVASNVCLRPEGVTLFKNRDIFDLTDKTRQLLLEKE